MKNPVAPCPTGLQVNQLIRGRKGISVKNRIPLAIKQWPKIAG
jgi:hypothetical protein